MDGDHQQFLVSHLYKTKYDYSQDGARVVLHTQRLKYGPDLVLAVQTDVSSACRVYHEIEAPWRETPARVRKSTAEMVSFALM